MKAGRLIVGLVLAAVAQLLSIFLAGAGHGWTSPLLFSMGLWVFIPTTLLLVRPVDHGNRSLLIAMVAVGLAADAWLIGRAVDEVDYIRRYIDINGALGLLIVLLWLGLWFFWQAMLIRALFAGGEGAHDAS